MEVLKMIDWALAIVAVLIKLSIPMLIIWVVLSKCPKIKDKIINFLNEGDEV